MSEIEKVKLSEQVLEDYMSYGMSTIVDRALPKVEDGFLPVQRKILYSMMANKMISEKDFFKCLDIIGNATKYYVHGDSSLMGSLSLLVDTNQTQSTPFILGHGNFGNTLTQGGYSAPRYTFAKLSGFSEKTLFDGIYDGVVDMIGDTEHKEPVCLPTMYPNILTMFTSAIAVGEACSFNGFNLKDICDYTSKYIKDKTLIASDYIIPDFPTDCKVIYNKENIKNICDTGKGSIKLRAIPRFDEENNILSMFIPYSTTVERVLKEITNKLNIFKEITDVKDGSGYNKKDQKEEYTVDLYLRKNINIDLLVNKLYKYTSLESNISYNMNSLINFVPKVRGINEVLDFWIKFRENCIIKLTNKEIETKSAKLHIMLGLQKVLIDIDEAIKLIRHTEEDKILKSLCDGFNIDEKQAQFIADMKLRNINKSYIEKQIKQIQELQKEVEYLQYIVSNIDEIDKIIIEQLQTISDKYGRPRLAEVIDVSEIIQIPQEEFIEEYNYNCRIFYTNKYIKKHLKQSDNHKIVEGNTILGDFITTNKSTLLIFTSKERRYKLQCSDLEQYQPSTHGTFVPKLLGFDEDEEIIKIVSIDKPTGFILVVYEDGNLAKIKIDKYLSSYKKLEKCYSNKSKILDIYYAEKDMDVLMVSDEGKGLIFNSSNFNAVGSTNSQGNVGMKLNEGNRVISAIIDVAKEFNFELETLKGKSKTFMLSDIVPTNKTNEERDLYTYLYSKRGNQGNFLINTRTNQDEVIKLVIK